MASSHAVEKLPVDRPITLDTHDQDFHAVIQSCTLPDELKSVLCRDGVFIGNPTRVARHLERLIRDGPDCVQVVADFDATLTRYHRDGKLCDSSHAILEQNPRMPLSYLEKAGRLLKKYRPLESDPLLTREEKSAHMREWSLASRSDLLEIQLNSTLIPALVEQSSTELREGFDALFRRMCDYEIPLMIYSAGIGDVILEVLNQRSNVKHSNQVPLLVANFLKFDSQGVLCGFGDELIHIFNKNEIFPQHLDHFKKHVKRRNVLLMGDALGDLRMAEGIPAKENVVTIGFLNAKIQSNFPAFRDSFDIVLVDDQTHDIPISIINAITKKP